MGVLEKLDELLDRLENYSLDDVQLPEEEAEEAVDAEEAEQVETPEDANRDESVDKMVQIIEAQQSRIDNLTMQLGKLVRDGANVNDGKSNETASPPSNIPDEYEFLKDLDYSM